MKEPYYNEEGIFMTGIEEIDEDHVRLFKILDETTEHINDGHFRLAYITVEMLFDYFVYHCAIEEAIMKKLDYPAINQHVAQHKRLQEILLSTLSTMLTTTNKTTEEILDTVVTKLRDAIRGHTMNEDNKFAEFLRDQ